MEQSAELRAELKRESRRTLISLAGAFALVIAGVFAFAQFYYSFIDKTLYAERLNQMREVTTQLFSGLEDVVQNEWRDVESECRTVMEERPRTWQQLCNFMQDQSFHSDYEAFQSEIIAVDENGAYYTKNGRQGLLPEREYLMNSPDAVNYVSNSMISDSSRMVFLRRLDRPITIQDGGSSFKIIYYGLAQNMEQLNPYFECSAYTGHSSVYVLDDNGLKLFSSSSSSDDLLKGFNTFTTLSEMSYLHGTNFADAKQSLAETGMAYSNAIQDGTELYYAMYKMANAEWTLLFLVPSDYVATNTVDLITTTVHLVLIFAVILVVFSVALITYMLRKQQAMVLDVQRRNNERLQKLNAELETASEAKTEFLSNMSHDIRTPMNAIVGITKLMAHDKDDPIKMETYIHKVQMSSQYLLSLINDVLDMSKIESGKVVLNTESVKIAEQVGQIDSIIRPRTEEHGQQFIIRVHEVSHEFVRCDAVRMRQILVNLLSNATKYTQKGGRIVLELAELPCDVPDCAKYTITVEDNGYGMKPEFVEHIFEPFTRAESSVTNKVQGTGLGMAITKNIVDLMGGTITVQSELHKGSRFEVTLTIPIDKDAEVELPCRSVLLITDEEDFITNVQAAFKHTGIAFTAARNKAETDAALAKEPVDIVLLGGSLQGEKLADHVQAVREKAGKALLFYCCNSGEESQLDGITANGGVDAVLARPLFLSSLANAIDRTRNNVPVNEDEEGSVLHGMHFLCAEDNALNAEILEAILDMNQATCKIYPNGQELVDAFATVKPGEYDAILMDVQMPVMNGLEATKAIRESENPLGRKIPIIAMTANAFSEDVQHCLDAGMDAHVAKPLDIATLERTLRSLVTPPGKLADGAPKFSRR